MRRRSGTTLIELLVVMSVWAFIMVAVLGFYIFGTRVNRRYDQMSQELRAVQQVADKFNTVLRQANLLEVVQFPPSVIFNRAEEFFPSLPGCLLPNVRTRTESIGIAPDPRRAGVGADPGTCKDNAIYLGLYGQPGQVIMQLPHGLIAEARVGVVGLGQAPRWWLSGGLRWRLFKSFYVIGSGGTAYFPSNTGVLVRGVMASGGVGVDIER